MNKSGNIQSKKVNYNAPISWLTKGMNDFIACPTLDLFYGILFTFFTYIYWNFLSNTPSLSDIAVPLLAIMVIIFGPISAMAMYDSSKRLSQGEKVSMQSILVIIKSAFNIKNAIPSIFLSIILIILVITWMIFTPLFYAVFNTDTFVNQNQTIIEDILADIMNFNNSLFIIVYFIFTAIIGWIAFMISWFSFPMVLDKNVEPLAASVASLKTAIANKVIMLTWIPTVGIIVLIGLLTPYFIGLIVIVPLLAHATWHAYKDMIEIE